VLSPRRKPVGWLPVRGSSMISSEEETAEGLSVRGS
jgi:hypothetical protein